MDAIPTGCFPVHTAGISAIFKDVIDLTYASPPKEDHDSATEEALKADSVQDFPLSLISPKLPNTVQELTELLAPLVSSTSSVQVRLIEAIIILYQPV